MPAGRFSGIAPLARVSAHCCRAKQHPLPLDWTAAAIAVALSLLPAVSPAIADNPGKHQPRHRWQSVLIAGLPAAIAVPCRDCAPDLILRCAARGQGLMQLEMPVATVANGRDGASKQVRLIVANNIEHRRSITRKTRRGFQPAIEFATDDRLLLRLSGNGVLNLRFYGQTRLVALAGASGPIATARRACAPAGQPATPHHCTWTVILACSANRRSAAATAAATPEAFVRKSEDVYCATIATDDLGHAKALVARFTARLQRSCLP